eukprot:4745037-Amphidinium_carterae.1
MLHGCFCCGSGTEDLLICCSYNVLYMTRYIHFDTTTKAGCACSLKGLPQCVLCRLCWGCSLPLEDYALDLSDQFQSGMDHAY